jgi:putative acetyltransferase
MKLLEVNEISLMLTEQLLEVWDKSVRATHLFLSDSEIKNIAEYIPQAFMLCQTLFPQAALFFADHS